MLRSLIPVGYMPMFGPGLSIGLMLCPAYAPVPASIATAHASMDMSGMDMSGMDMSGMDMSMGMPAQGPQRHPSTASTGSPAVPQSGSGHQDHTLCPYAASATLAAPPASFIAAVSGPCASVYTLFSPQISYIQLAPRAQSARGPPPTAQLVNS